MKAYPKLPTTATVLPAFCSGTVQLLQSLNMLRMPCIPVIWVQMERGAKYLYAHSALPRSPFVKAKREVECGDPDMQLAPQGWEYTMLQDGREVYRFATHALEKAARLAAEKIGFDLNDLDKVVPHQANMRIIETAMKYLKQPMEKVIVNIEHHGNTSSASIPIALDEGIREGKSREATRFVWLDLGLA